MKYAHFCLGAVIVASTLVSGLAQAQFVGESNKQITVEQLLKDGRNEQFVILEGNLVDQVGNEKYLFSDGTGQVQVEIDDKLFMGRKVTEQNVIRIEGEWDKELLETNEVDVNSFTIIR